MRICTQQATTRTQVTRTTTQQQQQQHQQQQAAAVAASTSSRAVQQVSGAGGGSGGQLWLSTGGDDDKVVLTGSGLQTARVNEHAEFTIDGTNAGYGNTHTLTNVQSSLNELVLRVRWPRANNKKLVLKGD